MSLELEHEKSLKELYPDVDFSSEEGVSKVAEDIIKKYLEQKGFYI